LSRSGAVPRREKTEATEDVFSTTVDERSTALLTPAPRWVRDYCREAARKIKSPVLCPTRTPSGLIATGNLEVFRPSAEGYLVEGQAEAHWAFSAGPGNVEGDYGAMRDLGVARVGKSKGRWLYAAETAGIHAGYLVLAWEGRGFH
jgi:hypothetical protein